MCKLLTVLIGILIAAGSVWAQKPHQVLVLVNNNSQASKKVANTYVSARDIPRQNMVFLDIPEDAYGGTATISPEEFTTLIWEPAHEAAKEHGVDKQILAWVYSVDFPIRVKTDKSDRKQMSVSGMTFMRNTMPGLDLVHDGKYLSKLFMGPNQRLKLSLGSMALEAHKDGLGDAVQVPPEAAWLQQGLGSERMPLPSMMLGYTGEIVISVTDVLATIIRGKRSDHRAMAGGIYFVLNDDVRSECREYQFYPAQNELKKRGITSMVTTNFPAGQSGVMGIMTGAETVTPSDIKSFAPGAMAEHLTSWSAEFQKKQTKMTEWIKAGATGSAGVVVEPFSNPNKFPSARFYVHYAAGCTMLESFYQSIACPLQNLLLGDPLARPYAPHFSVKLIGVDELTSDFTYLAVPSGKNLGNATFEFTFLLDGKVIQEKSEKNSCYIRQLKMADGYHELTVVANVNHPAQFSALQTKPFMVKHMGRSVVIQPETSRLGKYEHGLKVKMGGIQKPEKLQLRSGLRVLDEQAYSDEAELVMDEQMLGEGPHKVHAVAVYPDGMEVASKPISFAIQFSP